MRKTTEQTAEQLWRMPRDSSCGPSARIARTGAGRRAQRARIFDGTDGRASATATRTGTGWRGQLPAPGGGTRSPRRGPRRSTGRPRRVAVAAGIDPGQVAHAGAWMFGSTPRAAGALPVTREAADAASCAAKPRPEVASSRRFRFGEGGKLL